MATTIWIQPIGYNRTLGQHVSVFGPGRYNWKILFSGYAPAYAYEIGRLDTRLPFAELKRLSRINARAQAVGDAPEFSQRIRAGLPMPPPDS